MEMFILYLVLTEKPRFDDSNIVQMNLTREACEQASGLSNSTYHAMNPDSHPKYLWVCGPQPSPVDRHEDEVHPV